MKKAVRQRLLQLNRDFYDTVAGPFDRTRQGWTPGKRRLLDYLPDVDERTALKIADIGCGNGRFALMLDSLGQDVWYTGVDGNQHLLALACEQTEELSHVATRYYEVDLANAQWTEYAETSTQYDMIVCLATVQHMPGYDLRCRLMAELASLLTQDGLLAVSAWQFLESERFRQRLVDWHEIGLDASDVESGDALLPWKQGAYALRYVHQIDEIEMSRLVSDNDLVIKDTYRADGKEGNLNLYALIARQ